MEQNLIYLDHAAATPVDERVIKAMKPYLTDLFYNPSSPYMPAISVRRDYESAKQKLANLIGAKSGDLIMTAGATESINLAFSGITGHVITSNIEHHAVLACAKLCNHTLIESDEKGMISVEKIKKAIRPDTQMISIALANNELGTIQPLREIAVFVKKEREKRLIEGNKMPIYFHTDASQGAGLLDINVARLGVDMLTLNAGKVYGPKQVGLLWMSNQAKVEPKIIGGGQERGLRSGTENVAGTVGFAKAYELAYEHRKYESERLEKLRNYLQNILLEAFPEAVISGNQKCRLSNFLHISFSKIDAERLIFALEDRGVLVASGSACAANKGSRSHVLTAIGLLPELADGSIRITLGHLSNQQNIELAGKIIIEEIKREYERISR